MKKSAIADIVRNMKSPEEIFSGISSDISSAAEKADVNLSQVMEDIEKDREERIREEERKHQELVEAVQASTSFPWKETLITGLILGILCTLLGWFLGRYFSQ